MLVEREALTNVHAGIGETVLRETRTTKLPRNGMNAYIC
jgi:hypothetical protein